MNYYECYTFDDLQIVPAYSEIESRTDCDTSTRIVDNVKLKIPILSSPMDTVTEFEMVKELHRLGCAGVLHRFMNFHDLERQVRNIDIDPIIVSIGAHFKPIEFKLLYQEGVRVFLIDVAHGHSIHVKRTLKEIKSQYDDVKVIAGSIATAQAAKDLLRWGADGIRVGVGNGSLCETRIRTGVGVPQATAIEGVSQIIDLYENETGKRPSLIADGGIKTPGDVAKAIALGADVVMLGSLLAGTKESPGRLIRVGQFPDEQLFKLYRGSASQSAKVDRGEGDNHIEGNSKQIPYKGKVERIVRNIQDGLSSAMSYVGAKDLKEFREKVTFIKVTNAGQIEAQPHLLMKG